MTLAEVEQYRNKMRIVADFTWTQDKIGISLSKIFLPTKIGRSAKDSSTTERYFVYKFQSYSRRILPPLPVVSFCYIDEGLVATPGFETWLSQYAQLFDYLAGYRVVYVATKETRFAWAERLFRRVAGAFHPIDPVPALYPTIDS